MTDRADTYCDLCGACCTGNVHRFYGTGAGDFRDVCPDCTAKPIAELAESFKPAKPATP